MSFTTEELNYLIWRYLQETGLEISAFAMSDETTVTQFDEKFKDFVAIGSLVSLVQKGILYSQTDKLVKYNGDIQDEKYYKEKFTLFHALSSDSAINPPIEPTGRFEIDDGTSRLPSGVDSQRKGLVSGGESVISLISTDLSTLPTASTTEDFIRVPEKIFSFEPSTFADWNPTASTVLSYGLTEGRAKTTVLVEGKPEESKQITLNHPVAFIGLDDSESYSSDVTALSWSPKGHLLVTAIESGEIRLWTADGKLRNVLYLHHSPIIAIRWSPNSNFILTSDSDNSTILWDSQTGSAIQNFDLTRNETSNPPLQPLATSSSVSNNTSVANDTVSLGIDATWIDDSKFVIPGLNGAALVFNVGDRAPLGTLIGHNKSLSVIKYNKDGSLLLTASDDRTIRIWNGLSFNNSQILLGHSQPITFATWVNKNVVISTSLDSSIRLWDIRNGRQLAIRVLEGLPILLASFASDNTKLAIATTDNVITIFRVDINEKGDELKATNEYSLKIPDGEEENAGGSSTSFMTSLRWSSDSRFLVAAHSKAESVVLQIP
ncbi:hypothetical protein WICMUC_001917 [Wickerhamomyces mucosus]|uniref:IFT140 first beta-propeller domain-containing protein n=1 Tax=Wickerhamomyces mucosus TaxID=1378264 RepID=A0A9P8TFI9_9ASCO|nr:hypothetical protein WICMUC_001917 [Wickerhamomyces mucosus]